MLTPRQRQIAQLVARGKSYRRIADETGLSIHTVDKHIRDAAERIPHPGRTREKLIWFVYVHCSDDDAA